MAQWLIEDHISHEELKKEFRWLADVHYALLRALQNAPDMPPPQVLAILGESANATDGDDGRAHRRIYGSTDIIPPKAECESGAGLWLRIRRGLLSASTHSLQEEPHV
jgi:hypothetical protein